MLAKPPLRVHISLQDPTIQENQMVDVNTVRPIHHQIKTLKLSSH
jgi:hypothetical protein